MEFFVFMMIVLVIVIIVNSNSNTKKPPEDLYSKATSADTPKSQENLSDARIRLAEIQEENRIKIANFENESIFEVTGVHIATRKKRIKKTCVLGDQVIVYAEPENKFDPNAIVIENHEGILGYIKADDTEEVHDIIKVEHYAYISEIDDYDDYLTLHISIKY
ncbi:hypothetical protein FPN185_contig00011-0040 [Flavobacterium psychrophilum]|uniref:HIRAN domain-containing protein n=1 Tax=Flavobacterium psychrophilum TaxID=96345 RepID=UPI001154B09A|nr:HIRAN domain-containing protein [Flavobacterium psychrophilum]GEJ41400.1 hypothetical protein FPN185_contig00011-0040 [Flavobacterium psychrophilum]